MAKTTALNPITLNSRLAARYHQRQAALQVDSQRLSGRVGRLYGSLSGDLAKAAERAGIAGLSRLGELIDMEFGKIRRAIRAELERAGLRGWRLAADAIVAAVPAEWLPVLLGIAATRTAESIQEAGEEEFGTDDDLGAIRDWQQRLGKVGGVDREEAMRMIQELLFAAPSEADVDKWLSQGSPGGVPWDVRLAHWESKARAGMLSELTIGLADGENVAQLNKRLRPHTDGVAWKAQRIARTEANRAAEQANRATVDGMGDLVDGLQVVAVMDEWTRPEHAARNGRVFRRGDNGEYRDAAGDPLPDLPDQPNCRCMTIPVLAVPDEFKKDPVLRAAFKTASGDLIPDPASYTDWWERASEKERMTAVGAKRYQKTRDHTGKNRPEWTDFIGTDGRLLPIGEITSENEPDRIYRKMQVEAILAKRKAQYSDVASRGFLGTKAKSRALPQPQAKPPQPHPRTPAATVPPVAPPPKAIVPVTPPAVEVRPAIKPETPGEPIPKPPVQQLPMPPAQQQSPKKPAVEPDLQKAIAHHESKWRTAPLEHATVIDPATGEAVLTKIGKSDQLTFTASERAKMRGRIVTHNHPEGSPLSGVDGRFFVENGLREIRATGKGFDYSLKWKEGASIPDKTAHSTKLYNAWQRKYRTEARKVAERLGAEAKAGKIPYNELLKRIHAEEAIIQHDTWLSVADRYQLVYERIPNG